MLPAGAEGDPRVQLNSTGHDPGKQKRTAVNYEIISNCCLITLREVKHKVLQHIKSEIFGSSAKLEKTPHRK